MEIITFKEILNENELKNFYPAGCSGNVSYCCSRTCTYDRGYDVIEWDNYLDNESGVLMY